MAVLYAAEMAMHKKRIDHVILFASPRIGDDDFCHEYNRFLGKRTVRFEHVCDPVTRLPPSGLKYADVGRSIPIYFDTPNVFNHDIYGYYKAFKTGNMMKFYVDV